MRLPAVCVLLSRTVSIDETLVGLDWKRCGRCSARPQFTHVDGRDTCSALLYSACTLVNMSLRKSGNSKVATSEFRASRNLDDLLMMDLRGPRRMLDQTIFSECLLKERVRCDRGGPRFCLLIFESTDSSDAEQQIVEIGAILSKHLRITDELGRLENGVVGAVLTDTSVEGAWTVANKVVEKLPSDRNPPRASVYCYPSESAVDDGSKGGQQYASTVRDTDADDEGDDEGGEITNGKDSGTAVPRNDSTSLQQFFAQPASSLQRARDILASVLGLMLLSPVLLLVGLAVKMTSKGPVLFRQQRTGLGGVPFTILKFRTMRLGAEEEKAALLSQSEQDGPAFKMTRDPRITSIGGFLRRSSLDELPQLWNVLRGDMTLVGPRPLPCQEIDSCTNWQRRRLDVTPGLTCTWQVSGRSMVSFSEWMRLDLDYIQRRSAKGDMSLIVRTIQVVFKGTGR